MDIGAPVKVIADPAGQRRQDRAEAAPVVGQNFACGADQEIAILAGRVAGIGDGALRFGMFAEKGNLVTPARLRIVRGRIEAGGGIGVRIAGILGKGITQGSRQRESRVGSKDDAAGMGAGGSAERVRALRGGGLQLLADMRPDIFLLANRNVLAAKTVGATAHQFGMERVDRVGKVVQRGPSGIEILKEGKRE